MLKNRHIQGWLQASPLTLIKFWAANGVERVIVSRELSLEEIEEIREHCPETELEVFVHGALPRRFWRPAIG